MKQYFDVSVPLSPDIPVWEGDPKLEMTSLASIDGGDIANVSYIKMGVHIGTHIDAPIHFVPGRKGIDALDLNMLIGSCWVADLSTVEHEITANNLDEANIPAGVQRLLLKTSNSRLWGITPSTFDKDFVALAPSAAEWITARGIKLVGIDYLGIERYDQVPQGAPTHKILLREEVIIVEGLNLSGVESGKYHLICLPIKIKNSDGAPCRAILERE